LLLAGLLLRPGVGDAATLTGFLQGASPQARFGYGWAVTLGLLTDVVAVEAEYGRAVEEPGVASLVLLNGSLVVSLPFEVSRIRPYVTTGLGVYRQSLRDSRETSLATSQGVGLWLRLRAPAYARFDYRVLQLGGAPLQERQKRFYAGLSLRF
jgi:hypothetical protein